MNFMRKKPTVSLIDELSSIYNLLANQTLQNLSLEQRGEYDKAIRGWKSVHTQVLFRLDLVSKNYPNHEYTAEEYSVKDGIDDLIQKAIVHLTRVECTFNDLYPNQSRQPSIASMNSVTNPPSIPTLRSKSPQTFSLRQQQKPQAQAQQTSRLLKTLRPSNNKTLSSNSLTTPNVSSASWIAAHTATHSNTIHTTPSSPPKQNWSTSKPLGKQIPSSSNNANFDAFNTTADDFNIFDDSFKEDDLIDFNEKMQKRNESLSRLEAVGKESQLARFRPSDSALLSQFEKMQLSSSSSSPSPSPKSNNGFLNNNFLKISSQPEIKQVRSNTPPSRPPIPKTKPLIDIDSVASSKKMPSPKPSLPNHYITRQAPSETPSVKAKIKPTAPHVKPMVRPVIKSYTKQPSKQPTNSKITPKATHKPIHRTPTAAPSENKVNSKPKTTTPTNSNTLKPRRPPANSNANSRSRSHSPANQVVKETTSQINSTVNGEDKDESELTEKEIKEKMEDQLISEIQGIDYQAAKQIFSEIVVRGDEVHWDDIAGLETAKNSLKETVVYPFLRPDLFSGLREPARGMLLFGPPGTGKTMLARAVATESKSTFFSISASSLTSKYLGESEKLVRALFLLARKLSPAIIFVDEIDSILSSRSENGENESSRRIKNEFLIQWSNLTHAAAGNDHGEDLQRVLVLAATNLPWQIDEAARRRFVRRQYIPLPEFETRLSHLRKLLKHQIHNINEEEVFQLAEMTDGYSGSDITALAKDAAMGPLRSLGEKLLFTEKADIRGIELKDFVNSLKYIKPSVSMENLKEFDEWAEKFGSSGV